MQLSEHIICLERPSLPLLHPLELTQLAVLLTAWRRLDRAPAPALVAVEPRVPHCCRHTDDGTALVGGVGRCWKEQSTCPHACMLVDAYTASGTSEVSLACASGADLVLVDAPEAGDRGFGWVQDLLVDDGLVWFKSQPPDGSSFYPPGGVLWRADPMELTANLISRRSDSSAPPSRGAQR